MGNKESCKFAWSIMVIAIACMISLKFKHLLFILHHECLVDMNSVRAEVYQFHHNYNYCMHACMPEVDKNDVLKMM